MPARFLAGELWLTVNAYAGTGGADLAATCRGLRRALRAERNVCVTVTEARLAAGVLDWLGAAAPDVVQLTLAWSVAPEFDRRAHLLAVRPRRR